jgi:MFS family permease
MTENDIASPAPPDLAGPRGPGLGQLALLLAGSCTAVLGSVLISPVLPQMAAEFADTPGVDVLVPVVLTAPALVIGLTAPFAGLLVDRVDRKRLLVVGMVIYAVLGTAPLYLNSLVEILVSRIGVGICEAAIMTCCTTLIGDNWSGARRTRYLGLQVLVAALAATVFFGVGGALGTAGWRAPFWVYAATLLIAVAMAVALRTPARAPRGTHSLEPVPWRALLGPCAMTLVGNIWFYALIVELPFVLTARGVQDAGQIGLVAAGMSLATALGAIAIGRLGSRTPAVLIPVELALTAAGLIVVGTAAAVPVIVAGALVTGFGTGMLLPTLLTWTMNRLSFAQRGRGTGFWTASLFLGQFVCPLLIAGVAAVAGGLPVALAALGVAAAVAAAGTWRVLRGTHEPLNQSA